MQDTLIATHSLSLTGAADTPTLRGDVQVSFREWMPSQTVSLGSIGGGDGIASEYVDSHSNGFQMSRVDTEAIPAQMVNRESFGDRANQCLIGESVGQYLSTITPAYSESTIIPSIPACARPYPAIAAVPYWPLLIHTRPESYLWIDTRPSCFVDKGTNLAASPQSGVVQVAVPLSVVGIQAIGDSTSIRHSSPLKFDKPSIAHKE